MAENEIGAALITVPDEHVHGIFTTEGGIKPILADIANAVKDWTSPGVETEKARGEIKSMAFKLVRSRTYIETLGKREADAAKLLPKVIDANRRVAKETIQAIEDRIRAPLDAWEQNEAIRINSHKKAIENIKVLTLHHVLGSTAAEARNALASAESVKIGSECEEFEEEYRIAKQDAIEELSGLVLQREQHERDQAELIRLRAAEEQRQQAEREALAAQEREAAAKRAAERVKEEEARRAREAEERQRRAVEDARREEQEKAAQAERQRVAQEEAQRREDEKRAANRRHQGKVNSEAASAIEAVLNDHISPEGDSNAPIAREIVKAIAQSRIPHVSLRY